MNLFDYINKYGHYSFDEIAFNEVDNAIFSYLSYIDLDGIVDSKISIYDCYKKYTNKHKKRMIKKKFVSTRIGIEILSCIYDTKRYKDLLLYNYIYIKGHCQQFSAVTIEINKKLVYVSFEGTDEELAGWEEDYAMVYKFPVKAQKDAIKYLNRHFTFNRKKIIVGGHSKGGNLALVSAMYTNFWVRSRIKQIYSNDGPGLLLKQITSRKYKRVKDRYRLIISKYSVVGLLLRQDVNYTVVDTKGSMLGAHTMTNWKVDKLNFKRAELSRTSKIFDQGLTVWLNKYEYKERKLLGDCIFDIFREHNINTLLDLKNNKLKIINIVKSSSNIDVKYKKMFKEALKILLETGRKI